MARAFSDNVPVGEIDDLLTCSMCLETLTEPRSLPCFHNFCRVCLGKYVERHRGPHKKIEAFPCPTCRSEFTLKSNQDVAELPSSHFIKNMLEIIAVQQKAKMSPSCSRCESSAVGHCVTCEAFMCNKCSEAHETWFRNHDVLSVQELSNPESQVKIKRKLHCQKHEDKTLEYYCETCKDLCCIDCVVLNHQKPDHLCVTVREVARKKKETLQTSCATLEEKVSEGKEALNNICEVMKTLEKSAKTAKDQVEKQKEKILKMMAEKLDEKTKKIKEEVDEVCGEMHKELSEQRYEIKEYLDKVQASVSLPQNLLKRGSIEEIISSQELIDENIEKLTNEKPEDLSSANDGVIRHVPDDIRNINVDEIVGKLGFVEGSLSGLRYLKICSSILNSEVSFMKQLQKWLGEKCKWNLCYRASRDGWSAQDFHRHCDNKGPTVVLIKANDCIFGGYTDQNWGSGSGWKHSNSSFLFSLHNKSNLAPFIANINQGQETHAIYCNSGSGPTFGWGYDLHISRSPEINLSSYSQFGYTYQLPPGYDYKSEQANNLLGGQYQFKTTEIEVFT